MKFLVIGCGYFGSQVASLWQSQGHVVYVTTRTQGRFDEFTQQGLHPVVADVTQPETLTNLPPADVVLFSVGFDRSSDDDIRTVYVDGFKNVLQQLDTQLQHLIYISSTGVLASSDGNWIDESAKTAPSREGGRAHLEAEQILQASDFSQRSTILRLAGIYGPNRVPRLSAVIHRRWHLLPAEGHVNLIHVQDAAGITNRIIELQLKGTIFNVSDGQPPARKQLYEFVAQQIHAGEIDWSQPTDSIVALRSSGDKKVSNQKIIAETQYQYLYPDFRSGVPAAIDATDLTAIR